MGKPPGSNLGILLWQEGKAGNGNISVPAAKKSNEIPVVAASEPGGAQTQVAEWGVALCRLGVER